MEDLTKQLKEDGNKLFKENNFVEARKKYTEALSHDPSNSVIYSNRSLTSVKLGDYNLALSDAGECIKHNPQWSKGFLRKAVALEGLGRFSEVKTCAIEGFQLTGDGRIKRDLISLWFNANKVLNQLPEGSIELPRGVVIMSESYLHVLVCLMQSLNGEQPLSLSLMEQCLYSCAQQIETSLHDFREDGHSIIKEWAKYLPCEVYPYSTNPMVKSKLEKEMKSRNESFISFLNNKVDPTLYPVLRPILGLIVLVVLNRTNILTECNTGHHAAELMNRALVSLFESCILSTDDYASMHVGRLCAVLDSFIGRGYRLESEELATVRNFCKKLEKAIQNYPMSLPEATKDKQLAERSLSNVRNNILLPISLSAPTIPASSCMSVEMAEKIVKEKPKEVKAYIVKHLQELESVQFLSMGEVEELLTMTGIFYELGEEENALNVFKRGEEAFFQVLGHMLNSNTLKLDQCAATIVPMRQLVLNQVALLKNPSLFANVILRWKCLFKEFRTHVLQCSSGEVFSGFFQWYTDQLTSHKATNAEDTDAALLKQMQKEEQLLQKSAKSALASMAKTGYELKEKHLLDGDVTIDYIFFAPLKDNPSLEAYCVVCTNAQGPMVCKLKYKAIHDQALRVSKMLQSLADGGVIALNRINTELAHLAQLIFPPCFIELLSSRNINHLYISPDSHLATIPLDMLPIKIDTSALESLPLFKKLTVSILPSMRTLFVDNHKVTKPTKICSIIGNPNFELSKPTESTGIGNLVNYICGFFNISASSGPILGQLQHSKDELDYISLCLESRGLTVQTFVGDDANLSNVLTIQDPLLVHISSHAYCGPKKVSTFCGNFFDDLKSSSIALAGFNTFSRQQFDQLQPDCGPAQLPPLAIFSMKLHGTKLVFLSTCDSAAGTVSLQEAVNNLAQAFLVAGASTVIATLFPVSDQLASEFSQLFYDKLINPNVRPSEALAYAKQTLMTSDTATHRHWPNYAAFVCYGLDLPLF